MSTKTVNFLLGLVIWSLSVVGGASAKVHAAAAESTLEEDSSALSRALGFSLSFESSRNLLQDAFEASADSRIDGSLSYKITPTLQSALSGAVSRSWYGEAESTVDDVMLSLSHGAFDFVGSRYSSNLFVVLPASKSSRLRDSLVTSLTLRANFAFDLNKIGLDGLSVAYRPSVTRHVHQFTTASNGRSNNAFGLSNRLDLAYKISDSFSLMLSGTLATAWSYGGQARHSFRALQQVGYQWNESLSIAMGHRNGGSRTKPDGQTSNISLFNERSSVIYGSVGYQF